MYAGCRSVQALDPKTQQEMTAWFYKRQQEQQVNTGRMGSLAM